MTDEKYTFVTDIADKKRTARGSHNKRTHCGKGGAVRLPSDNLSKKELNAMNGEVKAYRLNDPMTWREFKALPDDLQAVYVKGLRSRFHVSDRQISEMLGISHCVASEYFGKHGLRSGHGKGRIAGFKKEDWVKWCNGIKTDRVEDVGEDPAPVEEIRGGEAQVNEPEKKVEGLPIKQKELIYRALGRIEGVAAGCDEVVKKCLLISVAQISVALGLIVEEEEEEL